MDDAGGDGHMQDPERFGIGRLFWSTSEAIIGADLAAEEIVLWNPAAERLFGYPAAEALGMPLERLVPDTLRPQHLAGIRRYREGDAAPALVGKGPVDVPARTKAGEERDVSLSLTDVSDGTDKRFVLALVRDVTDVRDVERQLQRTNSAMREFVATASHDLRTPLTSVIGFASTLRDLDESLSESNRREFIEAILRGATQATRLVDDLLTLSQIQAGVVVVHPEAVDVLAASREAVQLSGVDASVEIDPGVIVNVDPHHLERVLVNYLSNAGRYGAPPISVRAEAEADYVAVRVCDGGAGVPEAFEERLFTAFARADPTSREGTGLGLSIISGLAQVNGGAVLYERTADGCCFGVRLPPGN